jgi:hypothetical protein
MDGIKSLGDFKRCVQFLFDKNEEALEEHGKYHWAQLKAYLIEVNPKLVPHIPCPSGSWRPLDVSGWYINSAADDRRTHESFVLNRTGERVCTIFSLAEARISDYSIEKMVGETHGIDYCWLTRSLMKYWSDKENWMERGVGIKFEDGLRPEEHRSYLSMKAWYGAQGIDPEIEGVLRTLREKYAINSMRWQKISGNDVVISSEWYSNGKVTINRATEVEEALQCVIYMALVYEDELREATKIRDSVYAPFEIEFTRSIDVDGFSNVTSKGVGELKLWLVELEREDDYRRYSGVDLHTWDRVLMGVAPSYAHLVIPMDGCVNAAPRIATVHGEESAGKTSISIDGVEVFA